MYGLIQRIVIYAPIAVLVGIILERLWELIGPIMKAGEHSSPVIGMTEAVMTHWMFIGLISLLVMLVVGANAESEVA